MTKAIRLTDMQLILLTTAAARDNGSLLPPAATLIDGQSCLRKAITALIRRNLAKEIDVEPGADIWRTEGKRTIGVIITDAGRAAISVDPAATEIRDPLASRDAAPAVAAANEMPAVAPAPSPPSPPAAHTKTVLVIEMLIRESGATLDELMGATNWLPHTTRAALTGLRKKGYRIDRRKRGEVTCYHLVQA